MVHDKMRSTECPAGHVQGYAHSLLPGAARGVGLLPYWRRQHRPRRCADFKARDPIPASFWSEMNAILEYLNATY
jgi:hypothetical protein